MKTLILGLGNPILTDDSIGIKIAQKIKEENPGLQVAETSEAGLALLDHALDYDKLIIIDSIKTEQGQPGELYKLGLDDLKPGLDFSSSHGIDIATAFKLAEELGHKIPQSISIYVVEIKDNTSFGEKCTQELEKRIPFIARQIIERGKL